MEFGQTKERPEFGRTYYPTHEISGAEKVRRGKEKIISFIRIRGPSLPVQLAKEIGVSTLFVSAFLSELKSENQVKISEMRVGSSPLYYLSGQEKQLENFIEHLNQREREAFYLLQKGEVLADESQSPVVRVAIRAIKDFAIPIKVNTAGGEKIFWKYHLLSDENAIKTIKRMGKGEKEKEEIKKEEKKAKTEEKLVSPREQKKAKEVDSDFARDVRKYFAKRGIEEVETFFVKKKEFEARVKIDTLFGPQEFYLTAKDKKNLSDSDFAVSLQKAQTAKLPALVLSNGNLSKKGEDYLHEWRNIVKFEKMSL